MILVCGAISVAVIALSLLALRVVDAVHTRIRRARPVRIDPTLRHVAAISGKNAR